MSEQMTVRVSERSTGLWFLGTILGLAGAIYQTLNFTDLQTAGFVTRKMHGKHVETPKVTTIFWNLFPILGPLKVLHDKHSGLNLVLDAMNFPVEERMREGLGFWLYFIPLLGLILFIVDFFKWQGFMNQIAMGPPAK